MAINFDELRAAVAPAKATPKRDYSPYAMKADEDLVGYYDRLARTREGGILGTGGLMDVPKEGKLEADGDKQAGEEVVKEASTRSGEAVTDTPTEMERYKSSEAYKQGYSFEEWKAQGAIDRMRGVDYGAQGLLYGIPGAIVSATDKAYMKRELINNGYSEEQAAQMVNDPDYLGATHAMERTGTLPTKEYDYYKSGTQDSLGEALGGVVDSIFGTNILSRRNQDTSSMLPMSPSANQIPTMFGGRTAQIQAAQGKGLFDPYASIVDMSTNSMQKTFDSIYKQDDMDKMFASAIAQDAEKRRQAENARIAAETAAKAKAQAQANEAARQASISAAAPYAGQDWYSGTSVSDSGQYSNSSWNSSDSYSDFGSGTGSDDSSWD